MILLMLIPLEQVTRFLTLPLQVAIRGSEKWREILSAILKKKYLNVLEK